VLSGEFHTSYASDMGIFETRRARRLLAAFIAALFAIPFAAGSYWLDVANRAAIAVIAATGLNILTGFTGQISMGNAAFLAVGAYTTAFLANHGVPFLIACPLSGVSAALAGMIFGIPSLRLKGLYLAMATLAAHFIVEFAVTHLDSVTGGVSGTSVPAPSVFGLALGNAQRDLAAKIWIVDGFTPLSSKIPHLHASGTKEADQVVLELYSAMVTTNRDHNWGALD